MTPDSPEPWRYRLHIPPLDAAGYARLSALGLAPHVRRGGGRRIAVGFASAALVGAALGSLSAWGHWEAVIVLTGARPNFETVLDGTRALLAVMSVVVLTLAAMLLWQALWRAGLLRRLHAACAELHVGHELRLGDEGLEWSRRTGLLSLSWDGVRELRQDGDRHFLFLDDLSGIWLPDAALGGRRAEILDYIRQRIAAARGG